MATFLELAKKLAREGGGVDPGSITNVTGLTGRPEKIVNWIADAYTNIQNSRRDWGWLVSEFTGTLSIGASTYTPASFNLTRFGSWFGDRDWYMPLSLYDPAKGLSDEHEIPQVSYEYWRSRYGRGDQSITYWNRPTEFSYSPRNELIFGPTPDKAYKLRGQYTRGPQILAAATDIPEMPSRFHELIVWEAKRLMLISDGAYEEAQFPTMEMVALRHQLEIDQLPEVMVP